MTEALTVSVDPGGDDFSVHHFRIRGTGWPWANIYVRTAVIPEKDGHSRTLIEVVSNSDYGVFGHCWGYATGDWRTWLAKLNFDYAMGKMAGSRFMEDMDTDAQIENARRIIRDRRACGGMSAEDGHTLRTVLRDHVFEWGPQGFLRELDEQSGGLMYRHEIYDSRWQEPSAACRGFWEHLWTPFAAKLLEMVEDERAAEALENAA